MAGGASGAAGSAAGAGSGGAGAPALGGAAAAGSNSAGGSLASGGLSSGGGGSGGSGGGAGGTSGAGGSDANVAKELDGIRIDAPCAGTPAGTDSETCNHTVLMNNAFEATKVVSIAGNAATTYAVTLRIRGVVEPTSVDGGTRADTSTMVYKNGMWRKVPYTVGGTVKSPDYQAWKLSASSPPQNYFLNDYQQTAHNVFKLDYQITIDVAGGSKVTLDVTDSNEREIVNYEKYSLDGIAASMNLGQFVQVNVVSVQAK